MERDKFNLTFYKRDGSSYYLDPLLKEAGILAGFLNRYVCKNSKEWVEVKEVDNHKGLQIETTELPFILVFLTNFGKDYGGNEYFVFGNSRYAFSNNQILEYYVPDLNRAFHSEYDALRKLGWHAPTSPILEMQHCTLEQLWDLIEKEEIRPSCIWSPFDDPKFFDTGDAETNQDRKSIFQPLLLKRVEAKKPYVDELLSSIVNKTGPKSTCPSIICSGADGMSVMIDPSRIAAIVPESEPWDLLSAKVIISPATVRVDLRSLVKELSGVELREYHLPESMNEQSSDDYTIDFKEAKESAEELTKRFLDYKIQKQQGPDHSETDNSGDDEDDEIFDPDATFDDEEDDVFHPEFDDEEGE